MTRPRFRDALAVTVPFVMMSVSATLWLQHSSIYETHPQSVFWFIGLIFSKLVTHLQVAHVCKETYYPWRKTFLIPLLGITCNNGIALVNGGKYPAIEEATL